MERGESERVEITISSRFENIELVQTAIDAYVESARMSPDFSNGYAH